MRAPRTLTARLVATVVLLVAVVSATIAGITAFAVHQQQLQSLDEKVLSSVRRADDRDGDNTGGRSERPPPGAGNQSFGNQGPGTLISRIPTGSGTPSGIVLTDEPGTGRTLSTTDLGRLAEVPADSKVHSVSLPALGSYRVTAVTTGDGDRLVTGLPTRDADKTVTSLVGYEVLLITLGLAVAAGLGTLVVRRQLRPLKEVAATAHSVAGKELASGSIDLAERVPDRLTDERTEVGQMGSALNTLLAQVETALTERHRSEQQVRQFVADASHELRTPLATIHGYAELSRRTPDDAAVLSSALAKVETETDRMATLVEDLLLLARLDSGRPLEREEVDVTMLLLESVADARVLSPAHQWRLDLPEEPVSVTGDEQRLHQVVRNLLGNARAHTPPGTTVTVSTATDDDGARITVHDDGPGLPAGLADHAFERFTRGDSSRTRASGGAGLGLSLVAAITAAHGGTATVVSSPGDTTFTLLLPG